MNPIQKMCILYSRFQQTKKKEHFAPWKVKFDIDFNIKPLMTDEEKIAEHKLVDSLMALEQKIGFSS